MLPQRPEDRDVDHKRFGLCHRFLETAWGRQWLSRAVLTSELLGVALTIFSCTYISIYQSTTGLFCDDPSYLQSCIGITAP